MRNAHILSDRYFTDLFTPKVTIKDNSGLISFLIMNGSDTVSLLSNCQNIQVGYLGDVIDFPFELAFYFSLRLFLFQIPEINYSCFALVIQD